MTAQKLTTQKDHFIALSFPYKNGKTHKRYRSWVPFFLTFTKRDNTNSGIIASFGAHRHCVHRNCFDKLINVVHIINIACELFMAFAWDMRTWIYGGRWGNAMLKRWNVPRHKITTLIPGFSSAFDASKIKMNVLDMRVRKRNWAAGERSARHGSWCSTGGQFSVGVWRHPHQAHSWHRKIIWRKMFMNVCCYLCSFSGFYSSMWTGASDSLWRLNYCIVRKHTEKRQILRLNFWSIGFDHQKKNYALNVAGWFGHVPI